MALCKVDADCLSNEACFAMDLTNSRCLQLISADAECPFGQIISFREDAKTVLRACAPEPLQTSPASSDGGGWYFDWNRLPSLNSIDFDDFLLAVVGISLLFVLFSLLRSMFAPQGKNAPASAKKASTSNARRPSEPPAVKVVNSLRKPAPSAPTADHVKANTAAVSAPQPTRTPGPQGHALCTSCGATVCLQSLASPPPPPPSPPRYSPYPSI